jgi:DNA-binding NtrC family response regulator
MKIPPSNRKILVVDDEEMVREVLGEFLDLLNFQIENARDGAAGLAALEKNEYRAAFADVRMPKLDGIGFLRKSRRLRPDLPVVIITGQSSEEIKKEAMEAGAFAYLRKPFHYQEIKALLNRLAS